jgi:hypothetical protein
MIRGFPHEDAGVARAVEPALLGERSQDGEAKASIE